MGKLIRSLYPLRKRASAENSLESSAQTERQSFPLQIVSSLSSQPPCAFQHLNDAHYGMNKDDKGAQEEEVGCDKREGQDFVYTLKSLQSRIIN